MVKTRSMLKTDTKTDTELTMVKTRSMLKTDTKTDTEITMVQSRSMSKTNTKTATDTKKVERASKQTRKKARKNADYCSKPRSRLIDYNGLCLFMLDYIKRHPVPKITPTDTVHPVDALDFAGQAEWRQMSASEKAPFIKTAMENMGITMVQNRSMSKTDTKTATDTKKVERASKQTRKKTRKNADYRSKSRSRLLDFDGWCVFMKDYYKRYPVPNITPTGTNDPFHDMELAGHKEWTEMSASEKAPFIKTAKESVLARHI